MANFLYQTGTLSDLAALITKVKDFATGTPGYTLDSFASDGTGSRLHMHKGARYFNFRSFTSEAAPLFSTVQTGLFMNVGTGYSGASNWYSQAGTFTYNTTSKLLAGMVQLTGAIVAYHAFWFEDATAGYDVIYFFVEAPAGSYQYLMFGRMSCDNFGTGWTDPEGMFYVGSRHISQNTYSTNTTLFGPSVWSQPAPTSAVYGTVDGVTNWFPATNIPQSQLSPDRPYSLDTIYKSSSIWLNPPNSFNSAPIMIPVGVGVTRNTLDYVDTTPWSYIGELPYLQWINLMNINPGATITIATDEYLVVPFRKKSDTWDGNPDTGTYRFGLAIRTNV